MDTWIINIIKEINYKREIINEAKDYSIVTEIVKTTFAKEGEKLGFCSAAHRNLNIFKDFEFDEGEWMFDLVWFKMDEKDKQIMTNIPLVFESELSDKTLGGLKVDFDKLMVASSSTKVFLTTIHEIKSKREYIQKAINNFFEFKIDETLFLIVWDEEDEGDFTLEEFRKQLL